MQLPLVAINTTHVIPSIARNFPLRAVKKSGGANVKELLRAKSALGMRWKRPHAKER
jgi:hypothetical protein